MIKIAVLVANAVDQSRARRELCQISGSAEARALAVQCPRIKCIVRFLLFLARFRSLSIFRTRTGEDAAQEQYK